MSSRVWWGILLKKIEIICSCTRLYYLKAYSIWQRHGSLCFPPPVVWSPTYLHLPLLSNYCGFHFHNYPFSNPPLTWSLTCLLIYMENTVQIHMLKCSKIAFTFEREHIMLVFLSLNHLTPKFHFHLFTCQSPNFILIDNYGMLHCVNVLLSMHQLMGI